MNQTERRSILSKLRALPAGATLAAGTAALALALGFLGQWALDRWPAVPWGWAPLLAGAGLFAVAAGGQAIERERVEGKATARPRLAWLAAALALAALAFPGFSGNRFRPLPTVAWLASLALCHLAFAGPRRDREEAEERSGGGPVLPLLRGREGLHLSWHALALVGILVVGAWLRLHQLNAIPREMGTDMPHNYQNALQILQGQFMVFCPSYPGRESLFFYLLAGYGKLFGLSYFGIKFTSALVGLATIVALYGVARYVFDREVALMGAALLAVSKWHIILSRTGYRASLMPLAVLAVMYLVVRALRSGRATDWVWAGVATGLGMYTYNAFMIVPAALAAALVVELAREGRGALRRRAWGLAGLALGALLVFLPLGRYALEQPESYLFRVATRVSSVERALPEDLPAVVLGNLGRAAGMFNLRGDEVALNNVPHQRELGAVSGVLFLLGLAYAGSRWRRGQYALILVFLGCLLLPTALSVAFPNEVPNAGRASGAIAPAYLLAAMPLVLVRRRLATITLRARVPAPASTGATEQSLQGRRAAAMLVDPLPRWPARAQARRLLSAGVLALVSALVGLELVETRHAYFEEYVAHLPRRNYAISLEIARVLDDFAPEGQAFVRVWPHWFDGNALRAQLKVMSTSWDWEVPELDPAKPPLATARGKLLFVVHPDDRQTLAMLEAEFPKGVAINHRDYSGQVAFVTFYGER